MKYGVVPLGKDQSETAKDYIAQLEGAAKGVFHTFVIGVYFFPLLGGYLADRYFGKYNTILWFSLIYSVGQGCLALFIDEKWGFYTGLGLIALGSGGIKPLVASFMGDQFDSRTKHLAKLVFDGFYWIINFGSFFASLLMPLFLEHLGPRIAFGIPGVLMLTATVVFWLARDRYVRIDPPPRNPDSFLRVVETVLASGGLGLALAITGGLLGVGAIVLSVVGWLEIVPALCLALLLVLVFGGIGTSTQLERARGKHPDEAVDGVRAVLKVLVVFFLITPFWSLFDQKASTWVIQAKDMTKPEWFKPAMMQALNPALVMVLLPFNNIVLYPLLRSRGWNLSALRKMTVGIALAAIAWIIVGIFQIVIDGGDSFSIVWQILPYAFLTMGEVLVSATGLEFAYSQAPPSMKGAIMSFFNLSVTMGNLWVLLSDAGVKNATVTAAIEEQGMSTVGFLMFFFAGFALVAALVFHLFARRYQEVDHYRGGDGKPPAIPAARVVPPER
ncbi:MAG: MFS transporter [Deltaproteobacteria bacterium]|nr:MFS transporter [Deltaproteobacteria bacterium]